MSEETVEALIDGGEATAAPPLGPKLGPLGVNIGEVVSDINEKTEHFEGMEVPVTVRVDTDTKDFTVDVGTPPAAGLIMDEIGLDGASGRPLTEHVANMKMEQMIKISEMKKTDLLGKTPTARVKEIVGTCNSMGIMVEGKHAAATQQDIDDGVYDEKIENMETELSDDELEELEDQKEELLEEIKRKHQQEEERAQEIKDSMEEAERGEIVAVMREEGISEATINEVIPPEPGADVGMAKQGQYGEDDE